MPFPFSNEHDTYLRNYQTSKTSKVIGKGREVPILKKDGSLQNVMLSVMPQEIAGNIYYTGSMKSLLPTFEGVLSPIKESQPKPLLELERYHFI